MVVEVQTREPAAVAPERDLFATAVEQFQIAADVLGLDDDMRLILSHCQRELTVNFPVEMDDEGAVRAAVAETVAAVPEVVADYRRGKTAAIGRLIGETMKRTGGRAKPDEVRRLLEEALAER